MNLPIPHLHPDARHKKRMTLRNPRKLFDRNCMKCDIKIKTTYEPEREEIACNSKLQRRWMRSAIQYLTNICLTFILTMSKFFEKMSKFNNFLSINEAADILKVSTKTLRRWDQSHKLPAVRTNGGRLMYPLKSLTELLQNDLFWQAKIWAATNSDFLKETLYCQNRAIFEARNAAMEILLQKQIGKIYSIISSSTGEIGNNAFDHNLGKWMDIPGLYFDYDLKKGQIVLADRGQGILKTLQYILPNLSDHQEALYIAFTEVITGRAPERRGNGLKYVRRNVEKGYFDLTFQTGDAKMILKANEIFSNKNIQKTNITIPGCLAFIEFETNYLRI